jgi:hypothetical protein
MYNVHLVGTVDEEGFPAAVAAPYKIEDLLGTIARVLLKMVLTTWKEHGKPKVSSGNELQKV